MPPFFSSTTQNVEHYISFVLFAVKNKDRIQIWIWIFPDEQNAVPGLYLYPLA